MSSTNLATALVAPFEHLRMTDVESVGGKNASLGEMISQLAAAGVRVPGGFATTAHAFRQFLAHDGLAQKIKDRLAALNTDDVHALADAGAQIRQWIEQTPFPKDLDSAIRAEFERLTAENPGASFAVRSSATAEDMPDASFAGQQDTYLWISSADDVVHNVRKCWSSLFTDRAIAYRHSMGYLQQAIAMSVGVQKMIDPLASGVAFTLNPSNGDRSQIAVDASWGLGEAVVSGEVTPDNFLIDKVLREVVKREISDKHIEYRLNGSGVVEKADVEQERRKSPSVTDEDLIAIAMLARRAEKHYGCPQDIEWAIDRHLPTGENVVMLQSRPETVWSQKPREPVAKSAYSGLSSIVSTLLSPMHDKDSKS